MWVYFNCIGRRGRYGEIVFRQAKFGLRLIYGVLSYLMQALVRFLSVMLRVPQGIDL